MPMHASSHTQYPHGGCLNLCARVNMYALCVQELWVMLASAEKTESGVPQALLDAKVAEIDARQKAADEMKVCDLA